MNTSKLSRIAFHYENYAESLSNVASHYRNRAEAQRRFFPPDIPHDPKTPDASEASDEVANLENKVKWLEADVKRLRAESAKNAQRAKAAEEKISAATQSAGAGSDGAGMANPIKALGLDLDPITARNAIVLAEIVGPPVSRRAAIAARGVRG